MKILHNRDTQLHAFAIAAMMFAVHLFSQSWLWANIAGIIAALLWELKDYYLKRKDFGSLKNTVKYDWPDVLDFGWGVLLFNIAIAIHYFLTK